jgi:hypothetical protein
VGLKFRLLSFFYFYLEQFPINSPICSAGANLPYRLGTNVLKIINYVNEEITQWSYFLFQSKKLLYSCRMDLFLSHVKLFNKTIWLSTIATYICMYVQFQYYNVAKFDSRSSRSHLNNASDTYQSAPCDLSTPHPAMHLRNEVRELNKPHTKVPRMQSFHPKSSGKIHNDGPGYIMPVLCAV